LRAALAVTGATVTTGGAPGVTPGLRSASAAAVLGRAPGPERLRGILVDAARLPEQLPYYRRLIDFCREWDLNALLFRLTDDQGSALRFQSHPELVTHPHALTPDEARALAEYGARRGVTVIPEVESFGHTRYITAVSRHAQLEDREPRGAPGFTGLTPVAPETLTLIGDLYREVAGIFPSPYLHGGCDEVNWGSSVLSRRALQTRSRPEIWADYVNALDEICGRLGKELIVWGDVVVHREPEILPRLSRRVIVMDWRYHATDPRPVARVAAELVDQGRRIIGAPAIISCSWGPRPGERQLRNIDAFADAYAGIRDPRCLGIVVTNWVPTRYLQGSLWDSFAYAAVAIGRGSAAARQSAFRSFVERFHAADWDATWREVFEAYYRMAPSRRSCASDWPGTGLLVPWASEEDLRRAHAAEPIGPCPYTPLRELMWDAEESIRRHVGDFSALALSVEYLEHVFWRQAVLTEADAARHRPVVADLIETIATRDRRLVEKLDADWKAGRFSDSPGKLESAAGLEPADQLLLSMRRAAAFSAELAGDGGRFRRLLGS
jgi:hypothetical protein